MNSHLNEAEISSLACDDAISQAGQQHLGNCVSCRGRVAAFKNLVQSRRTEMEQDMPDWQRQKEAVLDRLPSNISAVSHRRSRWMRPAFAAAAVLVLALAAGLLRNPATPGLLPTPRPELPVEQILAQTESLLADEAIPGFDVFADLSDEDLDALLDVQDS